MSLFEAGDLVDVTGVSKGHGFTGTIEQVTATGADGGITWTLTYVPLDDGAAVAAA